NGVVANFGIKIGLIKIVGSFLGPTPHIEDHLYHRCNRHRAFLPPKILLPLRPAESKESWLPRETSTRRTNHGRWFQSRATQLRVAQRDMMFEGLSIKCSHGITRDSFAKITP